MDSGDDGGGDTAGGSTMAESTSKPPARPRPTVIAARAAPPGRPAQPANLSEAPSSGPARPPPASRPGRPPARPVSFEAADDDGGPAPPQPKGKPAPPPSRPVAAARTSLADDSPAPAIDGDDDGPSKGSESPAGPPTPSRSAVSADAVASRMSGGSPVPSRPGAPVSRPAPPAVATSKPAKPEPPGGKGGRPPPPRPKSFVENPPSSSPISEAPADATSDQSPTISRSPPVSSKPSAPPSRPAVAASRPPKPSAAPSKPAAPPAKPAAPPSKPAAPPAPGRPSAAARPPPPPSQQGGDSSGGGSAPGRPPPAAGRPPKPKPAVAAPPGRPPAAGGPPKPAPPKAAPAVMAEDAEESSSRVVPGQETMEGMESSPKPSRASPPLLTAKPKPPKPMSPTPRPTKDAEESSSRVVPGQETTEGMESSPKPSRASPPLLTAKPKPPKPMSPTPRPTKETVEDRVVPGQEAQKDVAPGPPAARPSKPKPPKPGLPPPMKSVEVDDERHVPGQEQSPAQSPPGVRKSIDEPVREEVEEAVTEAAEDQQPESEGILADDPIAPGREEPYTERSPPGGRPSKPPTRRPSAGPSKPAPPGGARPPPPKAGPSAKPPPPSAGPRRTSGSTRRSTSERTLSTDKTPPKSRRASAVEEPPPALPPRPGPGHVLFRYTVTEPHGICVREYEATQIDDLSMEKDDVIVLLERIDDNWLLGRNADNEGIFPQRHIRIVKKLASDMQMASGPSCVGMFDFDGESEDELSFKKGDLIELLAREGADWLKGKLEGRVGVFPRDFVEVLEDLPEGLEEEPPSTATDETYDKPCCRATFEFEGQDSTELSFSTGDFINIVGREDADWLKGQLNGKEGIFPDAFVDILKDIAVGETFDHSAAPDTASDKQDDPSTAETKDAETSGRTDPYCVATFDYQGEAADELTFSAGDEIFLLRRISDQWMEGVHVNRTGVFPVDFVEIKIDLPAEETEVQLSKNIKAETDLSPRVEALFDFDAENDDELSFKAGDIVYLLDREGSDWYMGELNNKIGKFPNNFVKIILDLP